jgi:hypothetical protein
MAGHSLNDPPYLINWGFRDDPDLELPREPDCASSCKTVKPFQADTVVTECTISASAAINATQICDPWVGLRILVGRDDRVFRPVGIGFAYSFDPHHSDCVSRGIRR